MGPVQPGDAARRQALFDAKLRALVRQAWGTDAGQGASSGSFPGGATLRSGRRGWILVEDRPERSLGGSLAWASRAGVEDLHLVLSGASGDVARRAAEFASPPSVWDAGGRALRPASPTPVPPEAEVPAAALALLDVLSGAGAVPVAEHGVLAGEVLGLEVARVAVNGSEAWLEVGVGKHDREAQRLVHGDRSPLESLAAAVAEVRRLRVQGAASHPANLLSPERWLRAAVLDDPALAGARRLTPVSSTVARQDLRSRAPAPAWGVDEDGEAVVAVCSTGIDPDLVPLAADVRVAARAGALAPAPWTDRPWDGAGPVRLVLLVPEGDDHAVTRSLAGALARPAVVRTVPAGWRGMGRERPEPSLP